MHVLIYIGFVVLLCPKTIHFPVRNSGQFPRYDRIMFVCCWARRRWITKRGRLRRHRLRRRPHRPGNECGNLSVLMFVRFVFFNIPKRSGSCFGEQSASLSRVWAPLCFENCRRRRPALFTRRIMSVRY